MGMVIGSHSVNHNLLSRLSEREQKIEIKNSKEILEEIIKKKCNFLVIPMEARSYNSITLKILNELNFDYITVQSNSFNEKDLKQIPLELPRFDCIEFDNC